MEPDVRSRIRRRAGLTLFQLARRVEISSGTLSQWERGQIKLSSPDIEKIAGAIEEELNRYPTPSSLAQIVSALSEPAGAPA